MIFKRNGFKKGLLKASFAIGNVLSLLFVILLLTSTNVSQKPAGILCSAASVLVVLGQFTITIAFINKIQLSLILKNMNNASNTWFQANAIQLSGTSVTSGGATGGKQQSRRTRARTISNLKKR